MSHPLQRIRDSALAFSQRSNLPPKSFKQTLPSIPDIRSIFHTPPPLVSHLCSVGLDDAIAEQLSRAYLQAAIELKHSCEKLLCCTWTEIAQNHDPSTGSISELNSQISSAYLSRYTRTLKKWADEVVALSRDRVRGDQCVTASDVTQSTQTSKETCRQKSSLVPKTGKVARPSFNQEYVPFLEKYFEYNAFPSHADKTRFAKKSLMSYRQIDVWFQNRRSRAKKEGKTLSKFPSDASTITLNLDSLEKRMSDWIIPEMDRAIPVDSDVSEYECQSDSEEEDNSAGLPKYARNPNVVDPFIIKAPLHAYPSVYPPTCHYDPFPAKSERSTFPAPVWMRRPARSTVERPTVDLDTLSKTFEAMTLREGAKRRWEKKKPQNPRLAANGKRTCLSGPRRDRSAATLFITTKPLAAPLSSLVQSKTSIRPTYSSLPILPSVPATMSRRHVFRSPSPGSRPTTLVPLPQSVAATEKLPRQRKISPLPKRTPASTSIAHRGHTPASSPAVSASPAQSRISSLGSDSPQTRTCSDSNSSSSSTVATPISPSTSLLDPGFAFSDLFGDTPMNALSPVEGLQLDFGSIGGGKQSFGLPCSPAHFLRVQS